MMRSCSLSLFSAMNLAGSEPVIDPPLSAAALSHGGLRLGLISNRHSGRNIKSLPEIEKIAAAHSLVTHRLVHSPDDIQSALEDLAQRRVDVVAINGGDGTVAAVLTCLFYCRPFKRMPPLVLLPGGSTNMTASDCGLRGNLKKALRKLCSWAQWGHVQGTPIQRPVLRVQPGSGCPPKYGMFFGAGAIIQGIEYCHANIHSIGLRDELGPGLAMLRTLWGIVRRDTRFVAPVPITTGLNQPEPSKTQDVMILLISTLERLFLGMCPYWGKQAAPLHFSLIRDGAEHLIRAFPALLRGRPNRYGKPEAGYLSHNVSEVHLTMDSSFTIDGELYQARVETGPVVVTDGGRVTFIRL